MIFLKNPLKKSPDHNYHLKNHQSKCRSSIKHDTSEGVLEFFCKEFIICFDLISEEDDNDCGEKIERNLAKFQKFESFF